MNATLTVPHWLIVLSWMSLAVGIASMILVAIDELREPQRMWIMNLVWPITALYGGLVGLLFYYRVGRLSTRGRARRAEAAGTEAPNRHKPFWQVTAVATTHCGAGCTLGDLVAEWGLVLVPLTLFGHRMFAAWAVDYVLAFLFGIAFQYFTIAPMKGLSPREGLVAALKADSLSLTAWQVGMYGWMAIATFVLFGRELEKTSPVFWFMMQIAMVAGFLTSYPVNWWLVKAGIKERM